MNDNTSIDKESWVQRTTLGRRAKTFYWKLDDAENVYITRYFDSKIGTPQQTSTIFSVEQITQIIDYVSQNGEVSLSNNVEKLAAGTEREGLGRFMYDTLKLNTVEAQTSSQLAALFVEAGIWQWNGQQRKMTFRANTTDWKNLLRKYYKRGLNVVAF